MGHGKPRHAARAHEQAHDAVAAARAARRRSAKIRLELDVQRSRADHGPAPVEIDAETEAVLRAYLDGPSTRTCDAGAGR